MTKAAWAAALVPPSTGGWPIFYALFDVYDCIKHEPRLCTSLYFTANVLT